MTGVALRILVYPTCLCPRGGFVFIVGLFSHHQVSEMAVSELPGNPNAVWTVKKNIDGR